ncbi:hypothetical protein BJV74DRAFT_242041 [Russula compacta]|nr:hypothetical protein BJV74DRAFT_242041 [Russula compacta]
MAPSQSSGSSTTSVQVALRIRPVTPQDAINIPARFQRTVIHATSSTSVSIDVTTSAPATSGAGTMTAPSSPSPVANAKKQHFTFDQVHGQDSTQHALFTATAQPLISRFLEGFNCTILAYGQTSSGKTYTMTGIDLEADPSDPTNGIGIIPRAVSSIFLHARSLKEERGGAWSYSVKGSFIEIYNEDLIDLLGDDGTGAKREVQIREGKDGSIIWGGLREVPVKNAIEVMSLIRQGTSIRRTNETEMNAQSSRSHAIFSLTLVQRKYRGSSLPLRSSSPLPTNGRSPSRLARPGSILAGSSGNRVSSPTFGRPGTPNMPPMGRTSMLRPASSLGHHDARGSLDDDSGEWVTVVSKFHFVDLAGSERLKRTAAVGDRIKEGISINSGLLALGNVISALGDPSRAKSHTASHVPYRDSKLTRLLQDSLGGNAHTLMIACVSPVEWNAAETVNTLKYANRARNIKNRATINEKEEGWDDVEWLQGMVTRLRKELKAIKEGALLSGEPTGPGTSQSSVESTASKRMLANYNELKNNYEELREKYVARNEELTRMRREHGEWHRASSSGTVAGMSKYEEIVGPVIEEYEKTISAMEAELSLNRAALRLTNDLVEEKEEELSQVTERKTAAELYIEELRARLAKLTEREASTEAYVHDLEEKMKQFDESSISSSESMSDLKRELSRFKDAESHSTKYIADLEMRLAKSDESLLTLREHVERLELECERRRDEARVLQERLEGLKKDGQSWRTDLEEREHRVCELEAKMEEWKEKKKEAGEAWERLGGVASEAQKERKRLEVDLVKAATSGSGSVSGSSTPGEPELALENQLVALQQAHTATLTDLSSVTAKYRDALREISDLAAQIQEAKLSNSAFTDSPDRSVDFGSHRRRMTGGRLKESSESPLNSAGRRHFFRQAASTESLHTRSLSQSVSLSQELSSARSRKTSFSSHGTSSPTQSPHRPNLSISLPSLSVSSHERSAASLEKEIMRLQDVLKEREQEIAHLEISLKEKEVVVSTPSGLQEAIGPHTVDNLDNPSVFLSPRTINQFDEIKTVLQQGSGPDSADMINNPESDESLDRLNELMRAMAQKESQHREVVEALNEELSQLRRQHDELTALSSNQTINMSNELGSLRSKHEDCLVRLEEVEHRKVEVQKALKQAKDDHTQAIEQLRLDHEQLLRVKEKEFDDLVARLNEEHASSLASLRDQLREAFLALEKAHQDHTEAFGRLKIEHEDELRQCLDTANASLAKVHEEHQGILTETKANHEEILKQKDAETAASLAKTEEEYYNGLVRLRTEHATVLEQQVAQAKMTLERLHEDHATELRVADLTREGLLSESQSAQADAIRNIQNEHAASLAKKEAAFADDLEKLKSRHAAALSKVQEEARKELEQSQKALIKAQEVYNDSSSRSREQFEASLLALREQQTAILKEVESGHQRDIAALMASHQGAIATLTSQAEQDRSVLQQHHAEELAGLRSTHERALVELAAGLTAQHDKAMQDVLASAEQERSLLAKTHDEESATSLVDHEKAVSSALQDLQAKHESEFQEALSQIQEERAALIHSHREQMATIQVQHERAIGDVNSALLAERDDHQRALEAARLQMEQTLTAEKERLGKVLEELERKHQQELESADKNHELLMEELTSHKAAAEEYLLAREQARKVHESALTKQSEIITSLHQDLSEAHNEREELAKEVELLKAQWEPPAASKLT